MPARYFIRLTSVSQGTVGVTAPHECLGVYQVKQPAPTIPGTDNRSTDFDLHPGRSQICTAT